MDNSQVARDTYAAYCYARDSGHLDFVKKAEACDQYFATLATWFGVDNSNLTTVFPNLGRFASSNLGFI